MENQNQNHGVLIGVPRVTDYLLGSATQIQVSRIVNDWTIYLSHPYDTQRSNVVDFLDCVTFSAGHSIEMQLNYLMAINQLSDEALHFFHNNNYIVDGVFRISKRFNAKLNGTDKLKGNYLTTVADHFRSDGFIPDSMWSETADMTWEQYYAPVPQNLIDLGKKVLLFISIQYQLVPATNVIAALQSTPLQVATEICPGWDSGEVVKKCSGQILAHATVIYGQQPSGNWKNLDQYPPYLQILAADYELPVNLQYIVLMKPISLRLGMVGNNVLTLQENLNKLGFKLETDGFYGPMTQTAVKNIQNKNGLIADGVVGPLTLGKIKDMLETPSGTSKGQYIDLWCAAIKQMEGAEPERNNPGNLRFIGQEYSVNNNGFCKFDTYQHGYNALQSLLVNACSGHSNLYNSKGTLYDFYNIYAPSSDGNNPKHYAEFVAKYIGVSPSVIISTLL